MSEQTLEPIVRALPYVPDYNLVLIVRDNTYRYIGQLDARDVTRASFTTRLGRVGAWVVEVDAEAPMASILATPGYGLVVFLNGTRMLSGPTTDINKTSEAGKSVQYVISGETDDIILNELAYPEPDKAADNQKTKAYDIRSGSAETVIRQYVNNNIGPNATDARQNTRLQLTADQQRGSQQKYSARFDVLGEMMLKIANRGGVGYRIIQVGNNLQLQFYSTRDLTKLVRFEINSGTLDSFSWTQSRPEVTRVVVAGQGDGTNRQILEVSTALSRATELIWGVRIREFLDERSTDDVDELRAAAIERLNDAGQTKIGIDFTARDTEQTQFLRDYNLGDKVTLIIDGIEIQDTVTEVTIEADSQDFYTSVVVGDPDVLGQTVGKRLLKQQQKAASRLSNIERNK